jgi:dTDP-4-dehydrorhamnose reductase
MKILIAGANGQLGVDCRRVLTGAHEVMGLDLPALDIADAASVARALDPFPAAVVVNCAAYTRVDDCETHREDAWRANALGPQVLAEACAARGILLIHISTDYVFDGEKAAPGVYREDDPVCPVSVYGRTKLEGEQAVCALSPRHIVLRTAWLYGAGGRNFLKTMLRLAVRPGGRPLRIVDDQRGSPTWSGRLAEQIAHLIVCGGQGVYHSAGLGGCTWYDLATYFFKSLGLSCAVERGTMADFPLPARRPRNSVLAAGRLKAEEVCVLRTWQEDVEMFVMQHGAELLAEAKAAAGR